MDGTKAAVTSVGVWGNTLGLILPIVTIMLQAMGASPNLWIAGIASILLNALGLYGRVSATKQISGVITSTPPSTPTIGP